MHAQIEAPTVNRDSNKSSKTAPNAVPLRGDGAANKENGEGEGGVDGADEAERPDRGEDEEPK